MLGASAIAAIIDTEAGRTPSRVELARLYGASLASFGLCHGCHHHQWLILLIHGCYFFDHE
jgi:hypothetical protein